MYRSTCLLFPCSSVVTMAGTTATVTCAPIHPMVGPAAALAHAGGSPATAIRCALKTNSMTTSSEVPPAMRKTRIYIGEA